MGPVRNSWTPVPVSRLPGAMSAPEGVSSGHDDGPACGEPKRPLAHLGGRVTTTEADMRDDGRTTDDGTKGGANLPAVRSARGRETLDRDDYIEPGTYWRYAPADAEGGMRGVEPGTVLLVENVEAVDGIQHTVVLAGHPDDQPRNTYHYIVERFLTDFAPSSPEVREKEIADLQARIADLSARITDGAPAPLPPVALPPPSNDPAHAEASRAVVAATQTWLEAQEAHAETVKERTREISNLTGVLGNYFSEKAKVALAQVGGALEHAADVRRRVATFDAYRGEDVQVAHHIEGKGADPDEPLVLYQRILHLDEETAAHHAAKGGVDFNVFNKRGAVRALYEEDPTLIDRLVPAQRGVALVRLRRHGKEYVDPSKPFADVTNAMLNEANKERWLVIRDGENVYHVHSEDLLYVQGNLFPSAAEMDGLMSDMNGNRIGQHDVALPRAKRRHDAVALAYRRILLLLQGLHDREGVFGEFAGLDRDGTPGNWGRDDAFMSERVKFVHDAEHGFEPFLPAFEKWVGTVANRYIPKGATVVLDTTWLREERDGYFMDANGRESEHRPPSRHVVSTVGRTKGRLYVTVPTSYRAFTSDRIVKRNVRIWLDTLGSDPEAVARGDMSSITVGLVRIDHLDVEDVRRRTASRALREDYLESMPVYAAAVAHLEANPVPADRRRVAEIVGSPVGAAADRAARLLEDDQGVLAAARRVADERGDVLRGVGIDENGHAILYVKDPDAPAFAGAPATVLSYRTDRPDARERGIMPTRTPATLWDAGDVPERSFDPSVGYRRHGPGHGGTVPFRTVTESLSLPWVAPTADELVDHMRDIQKRSSSMVAKDEVVRLIGVVHADFRGRVTEDGLPGHRLRTRAGTPLVIGTSEDVIDYAARVYGPKTADRMIRWYAHREDRYDPASHGKGSSTPAGFFAAAFEEMHETDGTWWNYAPPTPGFATKADGWRMGLAGAVASLGPSAPATFTLAECLDGFDRAWVDLLDEATMTPLEARWDLDRPLTTAKGSYGSNRRVTFADDVPEGTAPESPDAAPFGVRC